jgi:hypothetical protein
VATTFTGPRQRFYLRTFGHFTVNRPANGSHNLRISAVWIDSSDTVYAAAWPQPDFKPVNGSVPTVAVTPRVYRLDRRQWTDTGDTAASGSGGPDGWTAVLADNGSMTDGNGDWKGNLVVTSSQVHVTLAADVIAFAWAPPSSTAPPAPASSSGSPGEVQR